MSRVIQTLVNKENTAPFMAADFPSCKMFMPFNDSIGATGITDLVIGGTYTPLLGGFTFDGNSGVPSDPMIITDDLAHPDLGTDDFIFVVSADFGADNDFIKLLGAGGGANGDALTIGRDTTNGESSVADGTTKYLFAGSLGIDANTKAAALVADRGDAFGGGANFYSYEYDGTTFGEDDSVLVSASGVTLGIHLGTAGNGQLTTVGTPTIYGAALVQLTGTLSLQLVQDLVEWCDTNWRAGNKTLPNWMRGV